LPSEAKKITFDTAALFTAKVISLLLGLVRLKYIAVYLGVETFGVYTFATYFTAMFGLLFDLGLVQIITRDIAADRTKTEEYVLNGLLLKGALFIATSFVIALTTMLSRFDDLTNWAIAFSIFITGVNSSTLVFTGAFQAHRKMRLVSVVTIATDLLTSVVVIGMLISGYGLFGLLVGNVFACVLIFAASFIIYRHLSGLIRAKLNVRLWGYLLNEGYPAALGALGYVLYMYLTSTLLKYLKGDEAVGFYNAAFKIITILTVVPVSFTQVIYPFFSELHNKETEKLRSVLEISVRYMLIVSIPMALGTILVAGKLIPVFFTRAFMPAVLPLQILIVSSMFSFPNLVLYTFFPAINRQRFTMLATIPTGIFVAVFSFFLIPKYGIIVPSLSLVFAEVIVFTAACLYAHHLGMGLNLFRMFWKPILSCLPMATILYILSPFSVFLQVGAAIVTYAIAFYIFKGVSKEDRIILEKVLPAPIRATVLK
jgi:O-antigen/teichoic acid export membrane protein